MKGKRLWVVLACAFAFVLAITQPCLAAEPKTLKIGGLFALTGFGSSAETYIYQGAKIAEEWINDQGGITIKGQKYVIKLVAEDMKGTADGAVAAANKLLYDHKVTFVAGTVVPFMVTAAGSVLEPAQVVRSVLYNCGTPAEYGPNTPYMFMSGNATIEGIMPALEYLKEAYPEVKSVAYVIPDDGSVPYLDKIFRKKAAIAGYQVAAVEKWAMNTQDFTPVVTKILASKPDSIAFANGWPQATGSMLKIAREMGYQKPIFGCNYDDAYQIREIAGREASTDFFIHNLVLDDPDMTPMIKEITKRARAQHGKAYGWHPWGFNSVWVLVQAIEAAQSLDATAVRDTWAKMPSIKTVYGPGRMGGLKTYGINHTVCHPCPIQALVNGEVKWVKWVDVYSD
jgi:branched-chain amino acid transport system substrate-binding protein